MNMLLTKIKYNEHKWVVCGDLKVLSMLLGRQGGYTKCPCFLCLWTAELKMNTGFVSYGRKEMSLQLEKKYS